MSVTDTKQLEANIQAAREIVALGNALERLKHNQDFKAVVLTGYFKEEAVRLVHLKSAPGMQTGERQASILRDIDAIGALSSYFDAVRHLTMQAAKSLADDEATLEELAREELES